jgi:hypothetical protein
MKEFSEKIRFDQSGLQKRTEIEIKKTKNKKNTSSNSLQKL